jgi:hypothetical protein
MAGPPIQSPIVPAIRRCGQRLGRRHGVHHRAVPVDGEGERARAQCSQPFDFGEALDGTTVDRKDDVAQLGASHRSGAAGTTKSMRGATTERPDRTASPEDDDAR